MRRRKGGSNVFGESCLAGELVGHNDWYGELVREGVGEELGVWEVDSVAFCQEEDDFVVLWA